ARETVSVPHVSAARCVAACATSPTTVPSAVSPIGSLPIADGILAPAPTQSRALALTNARGEDEIVTGHLAEGLNGVGAEIDPAESGVPRAQDKARDPRELHGSRAHRTGLHGGVHGGADQNRRAVLARRSPHGLELGVPGHVALCILPVLARRQHDAIAQEDRAHG